MIIVLIVTLLSKVGGSPKHYLVEKRENHKEPLKTKTDDVANEYDGYYYGSYESIESYESGEYCKNL